ncbi:hypothetical protein AAHA92_25196 [Salvia divinorum]|uniref:Uncharacterized protein n=1 Tax=Salvia divinorum TaxID=28513 RepID=A0ABD1G9Y9_SALDI
MNCRLQLRRQSSHCTSRLLHRSPVTGRHLFYGLVQTELGPRSFLQHSLVLCPYLSLCQPPSQQQPPTTLQPTADRIATPPLHSPTPDAVPSALATRSCSRWCCRGSILGQLTPNASSDARCTSFTGRDRDVAGEKSLKLTSLDTRSHAHFLYEDKTVEEKEHT